MKENHIVSFYYPGRDIGGAQLLFSRIAEYLYHAGYPIKVYGDERCYIAKYLSENQVEFISSRTKLNGKFVVGEDELFILSLSVAADIGEEFNFFPDTRFIFWDLHPNCLVSQTALFDVYNKIVDDKVTGKVMRVLEKVRVEKIESMVVKAVEANGLIFMSDYNFTVNKNMFELPENVDLVPIPLTVNENGRSLDRNPEKGSGIIRIGWISRLMRHKNKVLSILVDDICASSYPTELTIIGDGNDRKYIENYVSRKKAENIKFAGRIGTNQLQEYLIQNIDLGVSVGTSALEFAKASIPTVLAPAAAQSRYFSKHNEGYAWLHQANGFDVNTYKENKDINQTFNEILRDYQSNDKAYGQYAYDYVYHNHSIESVGNRIIDLAKINRYTYKDLQSSGLSDKTPYQKFLFDTMGLYGTLKEKFIKH